MTRIVSSFDASGGFVRMKILLTGGCRFIGSAVVRHVLRATSHDIVNVAKMTDAAPGGRAAEKP
jgi:dTDP-D-glucose 4,6-dehydratase